MERLAKTKPDHRARNKGKPERRGSFDDSQLFYILLLRQVLLRRLRMRRARGYRWCFLGAVNIAGARAILVLVQPDLKQQAVAQAQRVVIPLRASIPMLSAPASSCGTFRIPYRVAGDGSIEAIMQGAMVRF